MSNEQPLAPKRKRPHWRLRVLLTVTALSLGLYVFVRLERSLAKRLGPVAVAIYDLFNQVPGKAAPLTDEAERLIADVKAMGGVPNVAVEKAGYFGTLGQTEWVNVSFRNSKFDDAALARLAEAHGSRIGGLYMENTEVTDAGLRHLKKFTMLRHLLIRNYPMRRGEPEAPPRITDAGMIHLKGLDHLWTLNLDDLPVTDAGLEAIKDLPELSSLYLSRTRVQGLGLARLKSLPRLSILYLDGSEIGEGGLKALAGATDLSILSLSRVPLSASSLPHLKAIPKLDKLYVTGCGLLDEEVDGLKKSKPGLRIGRD